MYSLYKQSTIKHNIITQVNIDYSTEICHQSNKTKQTKRNNPSSRIKSTTSQKQNRLFRHKLTQLLDLWARKTYRLISALRQQIRFNQLHFQIKNNNTPIRNKGNSKHLRANRITRVPNKKGMITTKVIKKNNTKIIPIIDLIKTNSKIEAQITIEVEIRAKATTTTKVTQANKEGVETTTISTKIEANIPQDNSNSDNSI